MNLTFLRTHPALAAGLAAILLLAPIASTQVSLYAAILLGWDVGVAIYLILALRLACSMTPQAMRAHAEEIDEGQDTVTTGAVIATLMALAAVVLELAGARGSGLAATLACVTVVLSWIFVHVLFAHRYAHENALRGGLVFPGEDAPDFLECLYFSFTVGMTAQVSDVTTNSASMRRLVLLHALLAFVFNAAVVATAVNLAAGLAA